MCILLSFLYSPLQNPRCNVWWTRWATCLLVWQTEIYHSPLPWFPHLYPRLNTARYMALCGSQSMGPWWLWTWPVLSWLSRCWDKRVAIPSARTCPTGGGTAISGTMHMALSQSEWIRHIDLPLRLLEMGQLAWICYSAKEFLSSQSILYSCYNNTCICTA